MYTLNCKGKLLSLDAPVVMGIINATDDSFYEGHLSLSTDQIIERAALMIQEGAAIIDIGGQSTKPGSKRLTASEEAERAIPVIKSIHKMFPEAILSIDTYHHEVSQWAVESGASIVNDVSGGNMDEAMIDTVANLAVPYICMHMQGSPETMQNNPTYTDILKDITDFFIQKVNQCKNAGIKDIIIDPGFGFGKTIEHNFEILKGMKVLSILNKPVLAGLSRKSTIYKTLGITAGESLNGTTVLNTLALNNGASILRVHDVKEAVEAVKLFNAYKNAAPEKSGI